MIEMKRNFLGDSSGLNASMNMAQQGDAQLQEAMSSSQAFQNMMRQQGAQTAQQAQQMQAQQDAKKKQLLSLGLMMAGGMGGGAGATEGATAATEGAAGTAAKAAGGASFGEKFADGANRLGKSVFNSPYFWLMAGGRR